MVWSKVQGGGIERECGKRSRGTGRQGVREHRTLNKVLVSSAREVILRERLHRAHTGGVLAPDKRSLRASGHNPPTEETSGGRDPPEEGGTEVGDREGVHSDRPHPAHREALGGADRSSGKAGRGGGGFRDQGRERQGGSTAAKGEGQRMEGTQEVRRAVASKATKKGRNSKNNT